MKKSKYISKYDYIAFYTKQKNFWFKTNAEITSEIQLLKSIYNKENSSSNVFDDEDDETLTNGEIEEIDSYEIYREKLEENINIDKNNSLIIEGSILDNESKKYIKSLFNDYIYYDFDEPQYKFKTMEELALETENILKKSSKVILFQAVFINENLITKCDAFIKENDFDYFLIETKGTTTAKFHHYLDLFFQKNVIESKDYLKNKNISYELCLIKYEYKNKYEVSFETTKYINVSKSPPILLKNDKEIIGDKEIVERKNKKKKGYYFDSNGDERGILISNLLCGDYSDIDLKIEIMDNANSEISLTNSKSVLETTYHEFNNTIKTLWNHKINLEEIETSSQKQKNKLLEIDIKPSVNDKGPFKNDDNWPELRKLYSMMGYNLFDYSGNVAIQNKINIENAKINDDPTNFLKSPSKNPQIYIDAFVNSNEEIQVDWNKTNSLFWKLKSANKKIYFDFETINTSIRCCDNSLPFSQIVTQCSIIIDEGKGSESSPCNNLIIDPNKIDIEWFKKVVDSIYYEPKNNDEKVLYIVYNKAFEQTRLKEISNYISIKEYDAKIEKIIKNLFDLADFFTFTTNKKYIVVKELCGFYSIKKVLPLIKKYNPNIYKKAKCLDYNTLEVKNGKECQGETNKRFFSLINDDNWKEIEEELKIYCENDVRAMIAIEYFIDYLINTHCSKN